MLAILRRESTNPNSLASRRWWQTAFPDHPYGRESQGTLDSVPRISAADLRGYVNHVFARNELTVSIVGDVDAKTAGELIDRAFAGLPAKGDLKPVASASPAGLGRRIVIDLDVPQAVVTFGGPGLARHDPDFMAGYVVNHILGGGTFSSRLYREVREKRGLAYGVSDSLVWFRRAAVVLGAPPPAPTAPPMRWRSLNPRPDGWPRTARPSTAAKSFLKGAYALSLDLSAKVAAQLTQIQLDNLGIDYIQKRGDHIDRRQHRRRQAGGEAALRRRHAGDGRRPAEGADLRRRVNRWHKACVSGR